MTCVWIQLISLDCFIHSLVEKSLICKLSKSPLKLCNFTDKNNSRNYTEFEQYVYIFKSLRNMFMQRRAAVACCIHNLCLKEPHSAHSHSRPWPDFSGNELWTKCSLRATRHFPLLGSNSSSGTLTQLGS